MFSDNVPWATILVGGLCAIYAIVGGAVVVFGEAGALSFEAYGDQLWKFVAGAGVLGVGRGLASGLKNQQSGSARLNDAELLSDLPPAPRGATTPPPGEAVTEPEGPHV